MQLVLRPHRWPMSLGRSSDSVAATTPYHVLVLWCLYSRLTTRRTEHCSVSESWDLAKDAVVRHYHQPILDGALGMQI